MRWEKDAGGIWRAQSGSLRVAAWRTRNGWRWTATEGARVVAVGTSRTVAGAKAEAANV